MRFEILMAANVNITTWDVRPCRLIDGYQRFGRTGFLHLQSEDAPCRGDMVLTQHGLILDKIVILKLELNSIDLLLVMCMFSVSFAQSTLKCLL
jgi:hypothetical protein